MRAAATVALVTAAACGSGGARAFVARHDGPATTTAPAPQKKTTESTTPGPIRPACALLSRDEVAAVLGNPVATGTGAGSNCFWATTVDGGTSATVTAVKPGAAGAADACNYLRLGQPTDAPHEQVSGVGVSAVWVFQPLTTLSQGSVVACWSDSAALVLLTGEHPMAALRATAIDLVQRLHAQS